MKRAPAKRAIKQDRARKTRQEILTSAIRLFARRGILATTMADLARAIHMTPGALYWHFPTKEDLLLAALEELTLRFTSSFQPLLAELRKWPAQRQLKLTLDHTLSYLEANREHGIFFGMVGAEVAESNETLATALRDSLSVFVDSIYNIIMWGQAHKEFREDVDARVLANAVIFSNIGIIVGHNLFRDSLSYTPLVQAIHGMVVTGLATAPAKK